MSELNPATLVEIDAEAYHEMPGVSQSMIKQFVEDPGIYRERYVLGQRPSGPEAKHFTWGKDFEKLVFYDELPGVVIPNEVLARSEREGKEIFSKRGAAWTEWKARQIEEHGEGVRLLRADEWAKDVEPYLIARDNLRLHGKAMKLLNGERHQVLTWQDEETGMPCKCQLDTVSRWRVLTDLKTSRDIRRSEFNRSVWKFGYHIQAEWYRKAWQRLTGELLPFTFVCVQTSPSYGCEAYDLDPKWYELAQQKIREGILGLAKAYETDRFVTPTFGTVTTLSPEPWMLYK